MTKFRHFISVQRFFRYKNSKHYHKVQVVKQPHEIELNLLILIKISAHFNLAF